MNIEVSSAQLQGGRRDQQDRLITRFVGDELIAIVADGLSGQPMGEWAAEAAAAGAAAELFDGRSSRINPARHTLQRAFKSAHRVVEGLVPQKRRDPPGTTLICGLFQEATNQVLIGSLGDSLIFRRRGDAFELLNEGHRSLRCVIGTNYRSSVSLFIHEDEMQPGDMYILASDGVEGKDFHAKLEEAARAESARSCVRAMIEEVLRAHIPRQDNVSIIAVKAYPSLRPEGPG